MTAAVVSDTATWCERGAVTLHVEHRPGAIRIHGHGHRQRVWLDMHVGEAREMVTQLQAAIRGAERWMVQPNQEGAR